MGDGKRNRQLNVEVGRSEKWSRQLYETAPFTVLKRRKAGQNRATRIERKHTYESQYGTKVLISIGDAQRNKHLSQAYTNEQCPAYVTYGVKFPKLPMEWCHGSLPYMVVYTTPPVIIFWVLEFYHPRWYTVGVWYTQYPR